MSAGASEVESPETPGAATVPRIVTNTVEFPYRRSLGPVVGCYFTALAAGRITGVRSGARVLCPPLEYDPDTGAATSGELIDVGPAGTVRSWTWVPVPDARHPLDRPFAFALIQLDGADTSLMHVVDAPESTLRSGLRVVARFRAEPKGRPDDLAYFIPEETAGSTDAVPGIVDAATAAARAGAEPAEPVATMEFWSSLTYKEALAPAGERYARSMMAGKLIGQRCPTCAKVYAPPRDFCPVDGIPLDESQDLVLPDRGVVTNFTIVTPVAYPGQKETEPFVRVSVLLDEVEALLGLQPVVDVANADVRPGMRVEAVWLPEAERSAEEFGNRGWGATTGAISGWRPTGEPDMPVDSYQDRVF
ncbi:OB-fold domain-containing protein [Frankia sp. AgB1.9]|uniref:Zn-ribbon domain-containing OB-fold protein n=1 Tax=unclassified Frankia TaxID=2632575 RepID=UPI00193383BA|nr:MULTISPECIES: OB-fold domain-containing protein [unclassified Frankia]MBL7491832.1 OB-fold domain-containing protein [Frankia sp. AgW1.1]MBL7549743.1 OB-fold domain-containing protein [Frankia sp. AgB1.9]MBL7618049.1 OB-fold domain-containing protein [Frankia sp. AgB1.8]